MSGEPTDDRPPGPEWDDPVQSGRDRSLTARLERAIAGDADELEPANESMAAVRAWLAADESDRTDVREILADLAVLPSLDYDEVRRDVAKGAGIRTSALDAERSELLRSTGNTNGNGHQGAAPMLADVEPWPEAVDGAELLADLASAIARYVALPDGAATAIALWVLFAHAHDAAHVSPLLALTSPEKQCGKTTVLSVLSKLVPRPVPASNISAAALFRAVEKYRPTLLVDEADTFLQDRDELRGVLNAGHTRATAYTVRCDGEDHDARLFSTWAPKVIAMIGRLPDTLEDRAVLVPMRRRAPDEEIERLRIDRLDGLGPLQQKAARWAADNLDKLRAADPDVPDGLRDRAADNWRPLLAIADAAGDPWPKRARKAAKLMSSSGDDDDGSVRTLLLSDLRQIFATVERMASADVVAELVELEHRPWPEWRRGNPLTARGLARLLEPFGVKPKQMKIDGSKVRGYECDELAEAWKRYLRPDTPDASGTPVQPAPSKGFSESTSGTPSEPVPDAIPPKPASLLDGTGVPDRHPPRGRADSEVDL